MISAIIESVLAGGVSTLLPEESQKTVCGQRGGIPGHRGPGSGKRGLAAGADPQRSGAAGDGDPREGPEGRDHGYHG